MELPPGTDRTVVVGLDGACFELLTPWIEAGELPTIERILSDGISGDLESVLPPITSPNWKAYSTGLNPGKLGIFWWQNVDVDNERTYVPSDRYNAHTEFWDLLAQEVPVGVIGVPMTNPPKQLDGFVVPGGPEAQSSGLQTHPPPVAEELQDRFGYSLTFDHSLREESEPAFGEIQKHIDTKFAAAKYLQDRFDVSFLQVTTFHINRLHHHCWDDDATLTAWKIIDDHLDAFLDDRTNLVLMSDHGMAEIESIFRINHWLREKGYLAYDTTVSETLYDLGINTGRLRRMLKRMDRVIPGDVARHSTNLVPQQVLNYLPNDRAELGASKFSQIDWDQSVAIASAQGPVYLTLDRENARYDSLREQMIGELEEVTDPEGRPIADAVYRTEEIYSGPFVSEAPDVVLDQADGTYVVEGIGQRDTFDSQDEVWQATNARFGMVAATGPSFATGTVDTMSILDLAPTLLHLHDVPVPPSMDGDVRRDVFASDSRPARTEPTFNSPGELVGESGRRSETTDLQDRLEDMGYL